MILDLDDVYEKVAGVSSNPYVTSTSDLANATASLLQPDLDKFRASCDILMKSLDVVAQIHPFASGERGFAVVPTGRTADEKFSRRTSF